MPSTSLQKKNPQVNSNSMKKLSVNKSKQMSCYVDGDVSSSQTESDDTEKSSSSRNQKNQSYQQGRRQHKKRTSTLQQKSHSEQTDLKSSTMVYAGPYFMIDAPSPSSLPLPATINSKPTKQQQQYLDDPKTYSMDPITELQEKLRMILNIQV